MEFKKCKIKKTPGVLPTVSIHVIFIQIRRSYIEVYKILNK